eukprot:CAMPEP_0118880436 /NCGR_PEP_ID=MMETSP1163-20130328/20015_1 /TAXON_ID=124430 /ORGANISM="Phaeomonas parva, Strain CCMP2877" /LENGTH=115 /DNA_ID=CAMNT_0006816845 /DNA_START=252 /DNA_END=599 /DNA_ORIENTATION=+
MVSRLVVSGAGARNVNGIYSERPADAVPACFARTCMAMGWEPKVTWEELSAGGAWYEAPNKSYIYLHKDGRYWMDGPTGAGEYAAADDGAGVPAAGWEPLGGMEPMPTVAPAEDL